MLLLCNLFLEVYIHGHLGNLAIMEIFIPWKWNFLSFESYISLEKSLRASGYFGKFYSLEMSFPDI